MSAAGWLRVANGVGQVVSAGSKLVLNKGGEVTGSLAKHGFDLANNTKTAAKAAGVSMPTIIETIPTTTVSASSFSASESGNKNYINDFDNTKENVVKVGDVQDIISVPITSAPATTEMELSNANDDERSVEKVQVQARSTKIDKPIDVDVDVEIPTTHPSIKLETMSNESSDVLKEGRAVPATRIARATGFASLGAGLAFGTIVEAASRVVSTVTGGTNSNNSKSGSSSSIIANEANADRLAATLCRMRGASLKMGQMLSMNDETLLPAPLSRALERVRQGAEAMPMSQLYEQLEKELGIDWRENFVSFEELPFAAASIGQVHRATILRNGMEMKVVVKVQYPGVATSIESDLSNLTMLVKMSGLAPPGLFIDRVVSVGRDELKVECDYTREAMNQERLRALIHQDAKLASANFRVPAVIEDLSTINILTSEYCPGGTIDKVANLDQDERNRIGRNIMRLTVKELFEWRFMQTDPNFGNFLYDVGSGNTHLIDFGSAREYSKSFVDGYFRIVWACANNDAETLMVQSRDMGFLTGDENDIMLEAHKLSGFTLGEPFATEGEYDFKDSGITSRISKHGSAFLQHRLTPPPKEVYTLHRKLAGAFNVCIRLGAKIKCRDLLEDVLANHTFDDGKDHPLRRL